MAKRGQDDLERIEKFANRVIVKEPKCRIILSESNQAPPSYSGLILIITRFLKKQQSGASKRATRRKLWAHRR